MTRDAEEADNPNAGAEEPPAPRVSGRPKELSPGHTVETITGGDRWMQAEAFLYDLYLQLGYCDESPQRRVEEMIRWADHSRFHAVIDGNDEIVGTIRTIFGRYHELPVGKFKRTDFSHEDPVCELASLVIRPGDRSTGVIENLYRNGWLDAFRSDSTSVVALIDPWLFRVFKDVYAMPFTVIGESHHYMGSDPVPVGMALDGPTYDDLARRNPGFWAWILEGASPEEIGAWGLPIVLPGADGVDEERTAAIRARARAEGQRSRR